MSLCAALAGAMTFALVLVFALMVAGVLLALVWGAFVILIVIPLGLVWSALRLAAEGVLALPSLVCAFARALARHWFAVGWYALMLLGLAYVNL